MTHTEVEVNVPGRVTIPAALRARLCLRAGSRLVVSVEDDRLVLEDRRHLLMRLQNEVAATVATQHEVSARGVADSLIADRRAEAKLETR